MPELIVEICSEEIPSNLQTYLADQLRREVERNLKVAELRYGNSQIFSTPRRIGFHLQGIPAKSEDKVVEKRGPRVNAPDKAVEGFRRSNNISRDDLAIRSTKNGDFYFLIQSISGSPVVSLLPAIITQSLASLNLPKSMSWGSHRTKWIRPIRSMLCLLVTDGRPEKVRFEFAGICSGSRTMGHHFMKPGWIEVSSYGSYVEKLKESKVIVDPEERKRIILNDAQAMCQSMDVELQLDDELLEEITGLVEWPVVMVGEIEERFQDLPPSVLYTTMKKHQRFMSARSKDGRISNFVTVANFIAADGGATILAGNQRVLSSRLADAQFFLDLDTKSHSRHGFQSTLKELEEVNYFDRLGSQKDRVDRIVCLAREIAGHADFDVDPKLVHEAALYSKSDLVSETVKELPELQGIMGRHFADRANLPPEVGRAIEDHYHPITQNGRLPSGNVGLVVSLADKINHMVGFTLIGETPSGLGDPNAVRRAAIGVIRILTEKEIEGFELRTVVRSSIRHHLNRGGLVIQLPGSLDDAVEGAIDFIHARYRIYAKQEFGFDNDLINACLAASNSDDLHSLTGRIRTLTAFLQTKPGMDLLHLDRRISKILNHADNSGADISTFEESFSFSENLLQEVHEKKLYNSLSVIQNMLQGLEGRSKAGPDKFGIKLQQVASLRLQVDDFFDNVTVLADEAAIQNNRLTLLSKVCEPLSGEVDLSLVRRRA